MKLTLAHPNRGVTALLAIVVICLLMVFISGMLVLVVRAIHKIDTHNTGGGSETNELAYTGPGFVVWQQTSMVQLPTNIMVAEQIEYTPDLRQPWQPLTNIVLNYGEVFDWTTLIDRTKPCGFFRITTYQTNQ